MLVSLIPFPSYLDSCSPPKNQTELCSVVLAARFTVVTGVVQCEQANPTIRVKSRPGFGKTAKCVKCYIMRLRPNYNVIRIGNRIYAQF